MNNTKVILWIVMVIILLIVILANFGLINMNFNGKNSIQNGNYANIPEKCRPPAGQDINAWKEHLSHHEETKDCLKYF